MTMDDCSRWIPAPKRSHPLPILSSDPTRPIHNHHGLKCVEWGAAVGSIFTHPSNQEASAAWYPIPMGFHLPVNKGRPMGSRTPSATRVEGWGWGGWEAKMSLLECMGPTQPWVKGDTCKLGSQAQESHQWTEEHSWERHRSF